MQRSRFTFQRVYLEMGSCVTTMASSSHDQPFLCHRKHTSLLFWLWRDKTNVCEGLTFLFLRRMTLMESVDTTMLTFFFFMFFSLNSYCGGRATTFNPTDAKCAFYLNLIYLSVCSKVFSRAFFFIFFFSV